MKRVLIDCLLVQVTRRTAIVTGTGIEIVIETGAPLRR